MENTNPFVPVPPNRLHCNTTKCPLEQLLDDFINPLDILEIDEFQFDDESVDTPLVSPFLDSGDDSDASKVLNELDEYRNARNFYPIGNDLAFYCMIGEFIVSDMADVVIGRPFRAVSQLEYDCVKGLILFTKIFDTYIFQMPSTIPRLKNFEWSLEYQIDEDIKEWLTHGHVSIDGVTKYGAIGEQADTAYLCLDFTCKPRRFEDQYADIFIGKRVGFQDSLASSEETGEVDPFLPAQVSHYILSDLPHPEIQRRSDGLTLNELANFYDVSSLRFMMSNNSTIMISRLEAKLRDDEGRLEAREDSVICGLKAENDRCRQFEEKEAILLATEDSLKNELEAL
ncbi:hypothetical protein Tco_1097244 [Tanacetum coccineum]